jgi:hypothetical protein
MTLAVAPLGVTERGVRPPVVLSDSCTERKCYGLPLVMPGIGGTADTDLGRPELARRTALDPKLKLISLTLRL